MRLNKVLLCLCAQLSLLAFRLNLDLLLLFLRKLPPLYRPYEESNLVSCPLDVFLNFFPDLPVLVKLRPD